MDAKYIVEKWLKFKFFWIIQLGYAVLEIKIWIHAVKCNNKKEKQILNIK